MRKVNESFRCEECGNYVQKAERISRNHCPFCFVSKHCDENTPGDRESQCQGKMVPVSYRISNSTVKIIFQCTKCGKQHVNQTHHDDEVGDIDYYLKFYRDNYGHLL